jgi:hypothetical protein
VHKKSGAYANVSLRMSRSNRGLTATPKHLRTAESTVGFNPISKAVKRVSATPAVLIVYLTS